MGTLPNGLTYYIRKNGRPEKRVSIQLAVKAGSVDETDDQQGLAHFLEHMAFNGSRNFKPGELIATLESTGARMGPHVNAYTSFDETVYQFEIPTDKPDIVTKGLQALADMGRQRRAMPGRDGLGPVAARQRARYAERGAPRRQGARPADAPAGTTRR